MSIKYRIDFAKYYPSRSSYTQEKEFNDEQHFKNYLNKMMHDQSKVKIIGHERIYSEAKEFSLQDLKNCFNEAKGKTFFDSFEEWFKNYFKRELI